MAKRDYSWWYKTAPKRPMSASQALRLDGCKRRWGFRYLDKHKEEQGVSAGKGDANHYEMELWNNFGYLPKDKASCVALRCAPAPRVADAEVPIRVETANVSWIGFLDLCYDWDETTNKPACLGSTGLTVVHDWKFCGSVDLSAMSEEELREDLAANLYAAAAFEAGAPRVACRWIYTQFDGKRAPREVWVEMDKAQVYEILAMWDEVAAEGEQLVQLHRKGKLKVLDLPPDLGHCFDYRKQCDYMELCNPPKEASKGFSMPSKGENVDFKSSISASFPGAAAPAPALKKAPPALPKKGPPALPKKEAPALNIPAGVAADAEATKVVEEYRGKPVAEAGFVNGGVDGQPVDLADSPEEAAKQQGRDVVQAPASDAPAAQTGDDLNALTRDQLKALGGQIGAFAPNTKARDATLREQIRAKRTELEDMAKQDLTLKGDLKTTQIEVKGHVYESVEALEKEMAGADNFVLSIGVVELKGAEAPVSGDFIDVPAPSDALKKMLSGDPIFIHVPTVSVTVSVPVNKLAEFQKAIADFAY